LGFDVSLQWLISFSISGLFSSLAGSLYTFHLNFILIESLRLSISGQIVVTALIGGTGYFFGPAVGTSIVSLLEDAVSTWIQRREPILGIFFVLVAIFLPKGYIQSPKRLGSLGANQGQKT
jgi:branched-chain amino acid transport system permease protein